MNIEAKPQPSPLAPYGLLETSLYVADLDAAEQFYSTLLNLRKHSAQPGRHAFFYCGSGMLLLFNPAATATASPGPVHGASLVPHGATGPGHVAFRIHENEIEAWRSRLAAANVDVESEIIWPQGGHSLYFRDPAGNSLELATPQLWGFSDDQI